MMIWLGELILCDVAHNFISDIFYLTLGFYHYGPIRSFVNYNEFKREHSEMKRQMDRMEQDIARMGNVSFCLLQKMIVC